MSKISDFYSGTDSSGRLILTPQFAASIARTYATHGLEGRGCAFDAATVDHEEARRAAFRRDFTIRLDRYKQKMRARDAAAGASPQQDYSDLQAYYDAQRGATGIADEMEAAAEGTRRQGEIHMALPTAEERERAIQNYKNRYGMDAARTFGQSHTELEAAYAKKRGRP